MRNVLVVDDDSQMLKAVTNALSARGYEVLLMTDPSRQFRTPHAAPAAERRTPATWPASRM